MTGDLLRLLAVTPDDEGLRDGLPLACAQAAGGGASAIVFREKSLDDDAFTSLALRCRDAARESGAAFILNERVHLAGVLRPDVVHLTWRSPDSSEARRQIEPDILLGRSCHRSRELEDTAMLDYVIFGPVFSTPSKEGLVEPCGIDGLARAVELAKCPVVAIGGLDEHNVANALATGARGVAVVRALLGSSTPEAAATRLCRVMGARS